MHRELGTHHGVQVMVHGVEDLPDSLRGSPTGVWRPATLQHFAEHFAVRCQRTTEPRCWRTRSGYSRTASDMEQKMTPDLDSSSRKEVRMEAESHT